MKHTVAWLIWTLAAATPALLTANPLYLAIVALAAWLSLATAGSGAGDSRGWRGLLKLSALVWLFTIPFNALMVHQGRVVLFRLPAHWPLVGGNVTLEAALYGVASGLRLWTLLLVFAVLNTCVDMSQLLRLTPAFLYQAGVVTSIALSFMPQMLLSAKEIREAQQIRGHRFRGWRDMLPLIMPLLTTSLERAIQLAESMESRGFGSVASEPPGQELRANLLRLAMLGALALVLVGLFLYGYWPQRPWIGLGMVGGASIILLFAFRALGRRLHRTHYRRMPWQRTDIVLVLISTAVPVGLLVCRTLDRLALTYYPYPPYPIIPAFRSGIGLLLCLLAAPALLNLWREHVGRAVPARSGKQGQDA